MRLVVWLAAVLVGVGALSAAEVTLEAGIRQVQAGELDAAVVTLDAVIRSMAAADAKPAGRLAQAYLYKGIALVGLAQEEPAKAAFRAALQQDPMLRLDQKDHPPRVVRVFDAAREGRTASVLEPPSTAPRKAGIGAAGVAAIAGGVVLLGGGAAVAVSGDGETAATPAPLLPTPTPTPAFTPTPSPSGPLTELPRVFLDGGAVYGVSTTFVVRARGTLDVTAHNGVGACQFAPASQAGVPYLTRIDLLPEGSSTPIDSAGCRRQTPCDSIDLVVPIEAGRYAIGVRRDQAMTQGHCFVGLRASFPGSGQ